ncbi:hypothetical protein EH240_36510 [Mesorhizobium tamadayense]|uniref:Uncharacterized protein n=1 Tax=Mesorhizobium tamadayense TaxID=425306 RepID=A0A3P3ELH9_9HYPH|nr:hypothetical protein EH240_36510 [Mesorhizobium tamadayense]
MAIATPRLSISGSIAVWSVNSSVSATNDHFPVHCRRGQAGCGLTLKRASSKIANARSPFLEIVRIEGAGDRRFFGPLRTLPLIARDIPTANPAAVLETVSCSSTFIRMVLFFPNVGAPEANLLATDSSTEQIALLFVSLDRQL